MLRQRHGINDATKPAGARCNLGLSRQGVMPMLKNVNGADGTGDRADRYGPFELYLRRLQAAHSASQSTAFASPPQDPAVLPTDNDWPPLTRPAAPFLMHLIATAQFAPQTCARRRADPDQAVAIYAAMMRKPASIPNGRRFARSR